MLTKPQIEEILQESGLLTHGHFLYTSGRHGDAYFEKARILEQPIYVEELMKHLSEHFNEDDIDLVVAPAVGAVILGYELARQLGIKSIFAERVDDKLTFRRGFTIPKGAKVIVAEDVITTGGSVMEMIELVRAAGGNPAGVALLVDRTNGKIDFGIKTAAAYTADVASYAAEDCPICKAGELPLVKPGSRAL